MFLPAQEAEERKFHQFVNITTLKNLCEHKDEIRQAVGLVALFIYSTVLQSQVCWKTLSQCWVQFRIVKASLSIGRRGPLQAIICHYKNSDTRSDFLWWDVQLYSDVQKKVIPAF